MFSLQIGSDGVIAFGSQSPSYSSVPEPFPASGRPILAPFWTEANYQNAGKVYYRVTNTSSLLQRAGEDISQAYSRVGVTRTVSQTELVIVTWKDLRSTADANLVSVCNFSLVVIATCALHTMHAWTREHEFMHANVFPCTTKTMSGTNFFLLCSLLSYACMHVTACHCMSWPACTSLACMMHVTVSIISIFCL